MANILIGLVVIAVAIAAEASQQHAQYVAAPRDFQTGAQPHTKHTSSVKVIHHHHIVPSVVSATALAHQQHAQRVAQEQQDRISKAAFGRGDAANNQRATVISTHMSHPSEGTSPSPVAYTLIRQRPLHQQRQHAPQPNKSQALKTASSSSALQYHPVMRYTTVIKHPSPGGGASGQASEYSTIPTGVYQKQFYGSAKYEVAGSAPYAKNPALSSKTYSPVAYDVNGVGPLSRPLYSPAAVKKEQPHHNQYQQQQQQQHHQFYQTSGPSIGEEESSNPGSLYSVSAHTVPEESPFNPSDVEAIEPSVQLPPEALKEILGDNYQDYYSSPSAQQQRPQYESAPSQQQQLFPQTLSVQQESPRKSIFGTPMKYIPHHQQRHQQQQQQQQAVLTTSTRHLTPHQLSSGPASEVSESEGPSSYSLQQPSGGSYQEQQQPTQHVVHSPPPSHSIIQQAPLVHSHASSQIQSPQRYQQALVPHSAYAQFGQFGAPAPVAHQNPYAAYLAYATSGHSGGHAVLASPQQSQLRPQQLTPSYAHHQEQPQQHQQQQAYFTQMTGHHAPPQYIAYQQVSSLPGRAAAAVQTEVGNNGVDSIKPDIDSVYSLPF